MVIVPSSLVIVAVPVSLVTVLVSLSTIVSLLAVALSDAIMSSSAASSASSSNVVSSPVVGASCIGSVGGCQCGYRWLGKDYYSRHYGRSQAGQQRHFLVVHRIKSSSGLFMKCRRTIRKTFHLFLRKLLAARYSTLYGLTQFLFLVILKMHLAKVVITVIAVPA
jgi:hypothetical protein